MKNKILRVLFISLIVVFSFFYTSKTVSFLKSINPIMKEIVKEKSKYEQPSINAKTINDEIIPGYNGISVNVDKSYTQMKKINKYNTNYYAYEISYPTLSIEDKYNKYITRGNYLKDSVAFLFRIEKENNTFIDIYKVLENKNVYGTFFIDGVFLKDNINDVITVTSDYHEIEVLSHNHSFNEEILVSSRNALQNVTNYSGKYCLTETKDDRVLNICKNNNMYTVVPTTVIKNFSDLKTNLESGSILEIKEDRIKELSTYINYVKQKGYNIITLEDLLSENRTTEK